MTLWGRPPRNETVTSLDCNPSKDKRSNALSPDRLITKEAQNSHPHRLTLLKSQILPRVERMASREKGGYLAIEGCEMERRWEEGPEEEKNWGACIRSNKEGASHPRTGYLHSQDTLHLVYGQGPDHREEHLTLLFCPAPPAKPCRLSRTYSTIVSFVGGRDMTCHHGPMPVMNRLYWFTVR